jgi:hypothetical protein
VKNGGRKKITAPSQRGEEKEEVGDEYKQNLALDKAHADSRDIFNKKVR